jgi:hypothetical protein
MHNTSFFFVDVCNCCGGVFVHELLNWVSTFQFYCVLLFDVCMLVCVKPHMHTFTRLMCVLLFVGHKWVYVCRCI